MEAKTERSVQRDLSMASIDLTREYSFSMAQGRDSAVMAVMLIGLLLLHSEMARAETFVVGDAAGWSMNIQTWPEGKKFKAGDTLVFNYDPKAHDVVKVDKAGFQNCEVGNGQTFRTGKDEIVLTKGCNFFICSIEGHCKAGMKIDVSAK